MPRCSNSSWIQNAVDMVHLPTSKSLSLSLPPFFLLQRLLEKLGLFLAVAFQPGEQAGQILTDLIQRITVPGRNLFQLLHNLPDGVAETIVLLFQTVHLLAQERFV